MRISKPAPTKITGLKVWLVNLHNANVIKINNSVKEELVCVKHLPFDMSSKVS
jgi:hypothetical protein